MGVDVRDYKAKSFLVSSMYAGLAGVLYALSIGSVAPDSFGLTLSVQFLAMIVLGGLGSVTGAILGATFVSAAAAGLPAVRRLAALHRRPRAAGHRGEPGGRLPLRRGDRPRRALRARRTRRPRAPLAAPHPCPRSCVCSHWGRSRSARHTGASRPVNRRRQLMKQEHQARGSHSLVGRPWCSPPRRAAPSPRTTPRGQDGVKVGRGIDGNTITLGALTDLTGVFAALGKDITNAQSLYWKTQNAATRSAARTRSRRPSRTTATTPSAASSSTARSTTTCWRSSRRSARRSTPA